MIFKTVNDYKSPEMNKQEFNPCYPSFLNTNIQASPRSLARAPNAKTERTDSVIPVN